MDSLSIPGPHGTIPIRVYRAAAAAAAEPGPALVWAHGGGFAWGDLDMPEAHWVSQKLALHGVTVVNVGYRLAPVSEALTDGGPAREGALFPVASEEVAAAAELAHKIAALPPEARFEPDEVRAMNLNYVGDAAELDNPYAFPGGHDLAGLPPTFVLNSEHDSLRASGQAFAAELALAGVDVTVCREPGTRHGHLHEPDNPGAHASIRRMAAWLHGAAPAALRPTPTPTPTPTPAAVA